MAIALNFPQMLQEALWQHHYVPWDAIGKRAGAGQRDARVKGELKFKETKKQQNPTLKNTSQHML